MVRAIADERDRVAIAFEHAEPAATQPHDGDREQPEADHHPLRLLARERRVDPVDHHDPDAREHRRQREQVRVRMGQREADHEVRGHAQPEEDRAVGQRHARGVVQRDVGRRRRALVLLLHEDGREATDDEQRRGQQSEQLAVARAQHALDCTTGASRRRTTRGGAPRSPTRPLPWCHGRRADPPCACHEPLRRSTTCLTNGRRASAGACGSASCSPAWRSSSCPPAATATAGLEKLTTFAQEALPASSHIGTLPGTITPGLRRRAADVPAHRLRPPRRVEGHLRPHRSAAQRHAAARAPGPEPGTDVGAVDPARPARDDPRPQDRRDVLPGEGQRRLHVRQLRPRQRRGGRARRADRQEAPRHPAQRDRRRRRSPASSTSSTSSAACT